MAGSVSTPDCQEADIDRLRRLIGNFKVCTPSRRRRGIGRPVSVLLAIDRTAPLGIRFQSAPGFPRRRPPATWASCSDAPARPTREPNRGPPGATNWRHVTPASARSWPHEAPCPRWSNALCAMLCEPALRRPRACVVGYCLAFRSCDRGDDGDRREVVRGRSCPLVPTAHEHAAAFRIRRRCGSLPRAVLLCVGEPPRSTPCMHDVISSTTARPPSSALA